MLTLEEILAAAGDDAPSGESLGRSREGREIVGHRFGAGSHRVSLIAGCHADEPTGPRLLRALVRALAGLPAAHGARADVSWWIVPHVNPDGEARNAAWQRSGAAAPDLVDFLRHSEREPPGDDVEFGFPRDDADDGARPETVAVREFWKRAGGPFHLHASLHGMSIAGGAYFLLDRTWIDRTEELRERCVAAVRELGYPLHDVDRGGEKGFTRIAPGFCTRPDSRAMAGHFERLGDAATAALFRPSSMEAIRALGGDTLTLASEMPQFLVPDLGGDAAASSGKMTAWRDRLSVWRAKVDRPGGDAEVRSEAKSAGVRAMPIVDQMRLQWAMVLAGLDASRLP